MCTPRFWFAAVSLALSVLAGAARAQTISMPNNTLEVAPVTGGYAVGAATTEGINAQNYTVELHGKITGLSHSNVSYVEVSLMPRSYWNPDNGAWNAGVYVVSWDASGLGLSLAADGVGGPYVYPLSNPSVSSPWDFTITLTPNGPSGGSATYEVAGQTLLGDTTPLAYSGDYSDAIIVVQFTSSNANAELSFIDLYATTILHPGDANGDGIVNLSDLQILGDNWLSTTAAWSTGDFTGDGNVNLADLQIIGDNWGHGTGPDLAFDEALSILAIPEPTAAACILAAASFMTLRRSRAM
ncbi:MAG: hypothetical protein IT445_02890 [Phycisphaeraceae bacterium]|nr:hypothetical protein [Phycisphaeraceae bacterium]